MAYLIGIILLIMIIVAVIQFVFPIFLLVLSVYLIYRLIRYIRKERYFRSEEFLNLKAELHSIVEEYNEVADYVKEIPNKTDFVADKSNFENSHLATFENTSNHNYKRDKNLKDIESTHVHNASLQIVRRASEEPIKYLTKYFNIGATEENLRKLEEIGDNASRLNNAIENLDLRFQKIKDDYNFPVYILKYYQKELAEKLDLNVPNIDVEYAEYNFEYVSAGGNSSQTTTITFNQETIEATAEYIAERIKYKKSAKAQRALMTQKLREKIKVRDDYTCQNCGVSIEDQSLLLLEVDHMIPVSKGGLSVEENLQTLCWKCNRTKSDKIIIDS